MTQEQLAGHIGRTVETISNIERGKTAPSLETVEKLSEALRIPMEEFFNDLGAHRNLSSKRQRQELEMRELIQSLPDRELDIAFKQIKALVEE